MEMELTVKVLSSLEKCFLDEDLSGHPETKSFIMFHNQRLSFQIALHRADITYRRAPRVSVEVGGALAPYVRIRQVTSVPSKYPAIPSFKDDYYLRTEPGLYPDLLQPLHYEGKITLAPLQTESVWFDVELVADVAPGVYAIPVCFRLPDSGEVIAETEAQVEVLKAELPKQKTIHTEWFYCDCIAEYYGVSAFSEKHWRIIRSFLTTAVRNGINMILTPLFTPELDTYVGGERLTTQLMDVRVVGKNQYEFDFSLLGRWIDLCLECGVEYFEFPHFFTQWGSEHAPKIVARVGNRKKRIFGWETDSMGEEYQAFLSQLLPALVAYLKEKGIDQKCFFHVSDEPKLENLDMYRRCRESLSRYLGDYPIIDALSDFDFYQSGAISKPIPAIKHSDPFLAAEIPGLWLYYCSAGGNNLGTTDRLIGMPLARTRVLGVQLYRYHIEGFLNWGYNFYNNQYSYDRINPFLDTTGDFFSPSGDTFLVYPGKNGEAWESIRLNAMREAMEDIRALELYEERFGRDAADALLREVAGMEITVWQYPRSADFLLTLRRRIAEAIRDQK